MRPLTVGDLVGRYRLEAVIGEGGMGRVYRARDESLHRQVALKVMSDAGALGAEAVARLLREARASAAFAHPNAVAIYDVGVDDGTPYLAMELVVGRPLRALLGDRGVDLKTKLRWLGDVARALGAAHRAGLVHRDVKPENVMVSDDGVVKVLDFGIARRSDDEAGASAATALARLTGDGIVVGTPMYMAPEQLEAKTIDGRADQFAWGVMAYELLAGALPWTATSGSPLVAEIVAREPTALVERASSVPRAVAEVVARAMKKAPADRFASMERLVEALEATPMSGAQPHTSAFASAPTVLAPVAPRRQGAAMGAGLLALVAFAAIVGGAWARSRATKAQSTNTASASVAKASSAIGSTPASASAGLDERPLPHSASPEALAYYVKARRHLRDAWIWEGHEEIALALKADPGLAAAHMLGVIYDTGHARESYRSAFALRDALDDRDRGIVTVADALYGATADGAEADRRARALAARYPRDAELLLLRRNIAVEGFDFARAASLAREAYAIDPTLAFALNGAGDDLKRAGDYAGARKVLGECLAASPNAVACITSLGQLDGREGRCDLAEQSLRKRLELSPGNPGVTQWLALAVDMNGASMEDALAVLHRAGAGPTGSENAQVFYEANLALLHGAFTTALADFARAEVFVEAMPEERTHLEDAYGEASVREESGDMRGAGRVARDFLDRRGRYGGHESAANFLLAPIAVRGGAMTKSEALALPLVPAAAAPIAPDVRAFWGDMLRLALVDDAASAREVLDALGGKAPFHRSAFDGDPDRAADALARVKLLAGDFDGAIAAAGPVSMRCEQWGTLSLRAMLLVARAREAKGDKAGACEASARVLARWGKATPRSVSGDEARARSAALRCGK